MFVKQRLYVILLIVWSIVIMSACGGSEYSDVKSVLQEMIDLNNDMLKNIENAETGDAVADAINSYADNMENVIPKFQEIIEKYPEIMTTIPDELKTYFEKFVESQKQLSQEDSVFIKKIAEFRGHIGIINAGKRLTGIGKRMQQIGKK